METGGGNSWEVSPRKPPLDQDCRLITLATSHKARQSQFLGSFSGFVVGASPHLPGWESGSGEGSSDRAG